MKARSQSTSWINGLILVIFAAAMLWLALRAGSPDTRDMPGLAETPAAVMPNDNSTAAATANAAVPSAPAANPALPTGAADLVRGQNEKSPVGESPGAAKAEGIKDNSATGTPDAGAWK